MWSPWMSPNKIVSRTINRRACGYQDFSSRLIKRVWPIEKEQEEKGFVFFL